MLLLRLSLKAQQLSPPQNFVISFSDGKNLTLYTSFCKIIVGNGGNSSPLCIYIIYVFEGVVVVNAGNGGGDGVAGGKMDGVKKDGRYKFSGRVCPP